MNGRFRQINTHPVHSIEREEDEAFHTPHVELHRGIEDRPLTLPDIVLCLNNNVLLPKVRTTVGVVFWSFEDGEFLSSSQRKRDPSLT